VTVHDGRARGDLRLYRVERLVGVIDNDDIEAAFFEVRDRLLDGRVVSCLVQRLVDLGVVCVVSFLL